jgi:hypothetical protein
MSCEKNGRGAECLCRRESVDADWWRGGCLGSVTWSDSSRLTPLGWTYRMQDESLCFPFLDNRPHVAQKKEKVSTSSLFYNGKKCSCVEAVMTNVGSANI